MSTSSCSTWLCWTLARSASGVVSLPGCGKTAVPGTRGSPRCVEVLDELAAASPPACRRLADTISRPRRQVVMTVNTHDRDEQRQPAAVRRPWTGWPPGRSASTPPKATAASASFHGRQCHSTRATSSSRIVSITRAPVTETPYAVASRSDGPERQHHRQHADEQGRVDAGQVDLAALVLGGLPDGHRRQQAQLHRLPGQRERAGDDGLAGDDGRGGGQHHHRQPRPARAAAGRTGSTRAPGWSQDQRRLAQVVQRQRREHDEEPGAPDRRPAEVAHVGVQRLGAGDDQDDRRPSRRTR